MRQYKANSTNSRTFSLTTDNTTIGELKYVNWYSFKAEIVLADNSNYQLEPKGFWLTKIELQKGGKTLLELEIGWKGILIKSLLGGSEEKYLLKLKGLLGSKFGLIDTNEKELLEVESDFKWKKLNFDYSIKTSDEFENIENKDLLLLTTLHCVNYYIAFANSSSF